MTSPGDPRERADGIRGIADTLRVMGEKGLSPLNWLGAITVAEELEGFAAEQVDLVARVEAAERERAAFLDTLWKIYVVTGADTDGDKTFHMPDANARQVTYASVEALRFDYRDAIDAAEERVKVLETLERTARDVPWDEIGVHGEDRSVGCGSVTSPGDPNVEWKLVLDYGGGEWETVKVVP